MENSCKRIRVAGSFKNNRSSMRNVQIVILRIGGIKKEKKEKKREKKEKKKRKKEKKREKKRKKKKKKGTKIRRLFSFNKDPAFKRVEDQRLRLFFLLLLLLSPLLFIY
jgi:hypothetical protein